MNIELQYLNHEFDVEWRTAPHLTNPLDDFISFPSLGRAFSSQPPG